MQRPVTQLRTAQMLTYAAGSVGTGTFYAFNNFVLPSVLQAFGASDLLIGLLSSTRSIEGALIQPAVGALSDRTRTRLGRRRPFLIGAIPVSAAFFLAAASATSLVPLAALIVLFSIFFNIAADPYAALLPDIAPPDQRGLLSGLATGVQLASSVGLLVIVAAASGSGRVPVWTYVAVAATMLVGFGITVLGTRERHDLADQPRRPAGRSWHAYLLPILEHRQAVRYLGTLFVYQFGLNAVVPYLVLFVTEDIHESAQTGFFISALLLMVMALSAVVCGKLADRFGTRRILTLGWALLCVSAVGGVLVRTLPQTVAVVLVAGVGNGAATATNWPLLTTLIPAEKTGVFAGLKAAAESVAIPLSVIVAAEVFLPRLGYRGIFAMLAINIVVALVLLVRFVHVPRAADPLTSAADLA